MSAAAADLTQGLSVLGEGFPTRTSDVEIDPFRILFVKPYQDTPTLVHAPPLGLLYLISALRKFYGDRVSFEMVDMKAHYLEADWLKGQLDKFSPDIVGVSAMNYEAAQAHKISAIVKEWKPDTLTMLGGAYALHQSEYIFDNSTFDWVIEGAAERVLPLALERYFTNQPLGDDLPGFSHRNTEGPYTLSVQVDAFRNLDILPHPAWDMIDFDLYASRPWELYMKPRRYATIFTSRGCPYLCNYCHDVFTKKFVHRSVENVLEEIELLHERYGINDIQIVDDIFNLHKPRMKAILGEATRRWSGKLQFGFPNGLRGDILDESVIKAMADAGTYYTAIAIETVTPRLQKLVEKNLNIERAFKSVDLLEEHGVFVKCFFMLGFPTETREELQATVNFALKSKMSMASFFTVVPQPGTPLYDLAKRENAEALETVTQAELGGGSGYRSSASWYQLAYGTSIRSVTRKANWQFYFGNPRRIVKLLRRVSLLTVLRSSRSIFNVLWPH